MGHAVSTADFYNQVQRNGKLLTTVQAQRWSAAVLRTLGLNLDASTKKRMAAVLPDELAAELRRPFLLLHFRDSGLSMEDFLNQVSRRSGNTDVKFASFPTQAIFGHLKTLLGADLSEQVAVALSPEVRQLWVQA